MTVRDPLPCSWNRRFEFLFPAIKNSLLTQRETKRWRVFAIFTREWYGCVFLSSGGSIYVPVCSGSGGMDANNKKCHISLSCLHLCPKIKSNMKIIEGTFVSAEDIITELRVFGNVWMFFLPGRQLNRVPLSGQARRLLPGVMIPVNRPFAGYWQKPWIQVMSGWFAHIAASGSIMLPNLTLSWCLFLLPPVKAFKLESGEWIFERDSGSRDSERIVPLSPSWNYFVYDLSSMTAGSPLLPLSWLDAQCFAQGIYGGLLRHSRQCGSQ